MASPMRIPRLGLAGATGAGKIRRHPQIRHHLCAAALCTLNTCARHKPRVLARIDRRLAVRFLKAETPASRAYLSNSIGFGPTIRWNRRG